MVVQRQTQKTFYRFIKEAAKLRASPSLSKYSCMVGFSMNLIFSIVFSTIAVISKKPIRLRRKAHTAISFAAFNIQGILPALNKAWVAKAKFLKVLTSGSSKLRLGYFLKSNLGKLFLMR